MAAVVPGQSAGSPGGQAAGAGARPEGLDRRHCRGIAGGCLWGELSAMDRITRGAAYCALCGVAIRPGEDALVTPDFLADAADPLWRFTDAAMHRACFLV